MWETACFTGVNIHFKMRLQPGHGLSATLKTDAKAAKKGPVLQALQLLMYEKID